MVKGLLPRMLLLWRNCFPRSNKELESEKARGDAFTWQVTLEGRAGALSAMYSFLLHCPELLNDDITRRLLTPIESALAMLTKYECLNASPLKINFTTFSYKCFFQSVTRFEKLWSTVESSRGYGPFALVRNVIVVTTANVRR